MSSLAHSKTQIYPGAGSAAEDPTKSYKGFKFIFATGLLKKLFFTKFKLIFHNP